MDFHIRRDPELLDSTGYMEIGPGRYSGKHWQRGHLFIWEGAFGMAEGIVAKHFPQYDHCGMNDIPKGVGLSIADAWEKAADFLAQKPSIPESADILNLTASFGSALPEAVALQPESIASMLREVAAGLREFYRKNEWVCILGM